MSQIGNDNIANILVTNYVNHTHTEYIILSVTCIASLNLQVNATGIYTEKLVIFVDIELVFRYIMRSNNRNTYTCFPARH